MTQAKKCSKLPAHDLRGQFGKLSLAEQLAVTNFFNLHNAATWVFDTMSKDAQLYAENCIRLSKESWKESKKDV